jgi:hypothetical protein
MSIVDEIDPDCTVSSIQGDRQDKEPQPERPQIQQE